MISLRYHIVSIAAVFLALAVGVVLGSTALNGSLLAGLADDNAGLGQRVSELQAERNQLSAELDKADTFASTIGPRAVDGTLDKRTVVLITTPSASPADRDALKEVLGQAGARVTGELQLTEGFTDTNRAEELREVVTRSLPSGAELPTAADSGALAGGLIGTLVHLDKNNKRQANQDESAAALSALVDSGFVKPVEQIKPAQLSVVLTGGAERGDDAANQASTIARFATQLDRTGAGSVLAGGRGSADGTGPIGVARADTASTSILSTVDNAHSSAGRISTVLALREQLQGDAGRYGVAGNAQSPVPGAGKNNG